MNVKIPILISFAYMKESLIATLQEHKDTFEVILDSGAFTAFNTGRTITVQDYMKFLEKPPLDFSFYFSLDSIGNPQKSMENFNILCKEGFNPVPVYTRGDTKNEFDYYYKARDFIGIGGIAGTEDNRYYLHKLYQDKMITSHKVHWLGFWDRDFLLHYKPFSCDTQSWMSAARYGRSWYIKHRKLLSFNRKNYQSPNVKAYCAKYGIDNNLLRLDDNWRWDGKCASLSQEIQSLAALEYVNLIRATTGTKIYLACSGNQGNLEACLLYNVYKKYGIIN